MKEVVYLLEDDSSIIELVICALEMNGLSVVSYSSCEQFKKDIFSGDASIAVLDIMLPDGNGLDVLKFIKQSSDLPVIMLSALSRETDKVKGLNFGADDYLAKPFGVLEFVARVKANIRKKSVNKVEVLTSGNLTLNTQTMKVTIADKIIDLNSMEYALLKYFMENKNIALSRAKLLEKVWGYDAAQTRTVDNHVARLRKLVGERIETIFNFGYKFKE